MIGKKVKFRKYPSSTSYLEGIIQDKYEGSISVEQEMASGRGGTVTVRYHKITGSYYVILTKEGEMLHHIQCSDVLYII